MPVSANNSQLANQILEEAARRKAGPGTKAAQPSAEAKPKIYEVGRIITVGSSQAIMSVNKAVIRNNLLHIAELGAVLKIKTRETLVICMVDSLTVGREDEEGMSDGCLIELTIMGEIVRSPIDGQKKFYRGVRSFPVINEPVYTVTRDELKLVFASNSKQTINIGSLQQDMSIAAEVRTDDLLSKHFAVVGSTGSGKSCTVALLLQAVLQGHDNGHVVLFDPHNEYSASFGPRANVITAQNLELPLWLLDFEETVGLLASDVPNQRREEVEILSSIILKAKNDFERNPMNDKGERISIRKGRAPSLNSPSPYRVHDLLRMLDEAMGRLENSSNLSPYMRLKRRLEIMLKDKRYDFIFKNGPFPNDLKSILGNIFRLPVQGKPISILDLSGIPSEALNVVVSVICRLAFDLAVWSERKIPILLVCEEAHRYIPNEKDDGFSATRKAIGRIAKEGRKYGVSIGLISQRPSELDPTALSQCSTVFSMRLNNERDQRFVKAAIPDGAGSMLSYLPSLGTAETMVFGESVNLPMRVIMRTLEEEYRPHSSSASFTKMWGGREIDPGELHRVFDNWAAGAKEETAPQVQSSLLKKPIAQAAAAVHQNQTQQPRSQNPSPNTPKDSPAATSPEATSKYAALRQALMKKS